MERVGIKGVRGKAGWNILKSCVYYSSKCSFLFGSIGDVGPNVIISCLGQWLKHLVMLLDGRNIQDFRYLDDIPNYDKNDIKITQVYKSDKM